MWYGTLVIIAVSILCIIIWFIFGFRQRESRAWNPSNTGNRILLVGDSTLDNAYWVHKGERDLTELFELEGKYDVLNYAVDNSRIADVMNGMSPEHVYRNNRRYAYPVESNDKVEPMQHVGEANYVVLSIGGNDGRQRLSQGSTLAGLSAEYRALVQAIRAQCPKVILVIPYMPCFAIADPAMKTQRGTVETFMNEWRKAVMQIGTELHLPVIDLSVDIDSEDRSYYGTTCIEPSEKGSQVIKDRIEKVIEEFTFL